ncbi:MAG: hypothetical protein ACI970_000325 [Myxococcota bacterium]|jgi:hypothetical protein
MPQLPIADRADIVLPPADADALARLAAVDGANIGAVAAIVADHPTFLEGWAMLAMLAGGAIERYAYARVGYHRGLDAMRGAGWGGSNLLRWAHPTNRGMHRCLGALRDAAREIGEVPEVARLDEFLAFLDPAWDDAFLAG